MKNILISILCLLLSNILWAEPISRQQAQQRAMSFLQEKGKTVSSSHIRHAPSRRSVAKEEEPYYVFNVRGDEGFVIVSGDDRTLPVLGYSYSGSFDKEHIPDNMKAWLKGYSDQIEWLQSHPQSRQVKHIVKGTAISPLISTRWDQTYPYNELCPTDGSFHYPTGCVATAMAQVMYYHHWPKQTKVEIPSYNTYLQNIFMPAIGTGTTIDWANMLPFYNGSESSVQRLAVAQLMVMCGTSVEMDYDSSGSGSNMTIAANALSNYFDYDASIKLEERTSYIEKEWNQIIYDELSAGRPVIYSGMSDYGKTSGHTFVIDGYDGDNFFHVNWGWGGHKDSYFLLSVLDDNASGDGVTKSIDGFSWGQCAIIGIQPNTGKPKIEDAKMTTWFIALPDGSPDNYTRSSLNENFTFTVVGNMFNLTEGTNTFDCGAYGLFDMEDNLISVGCDYYSRTYDQLFGADNIKRIVNFGANISSGHFKVKAISRQSGTLIWNDNSKYPSCFIETIISGNNLKLIAPSVDLEGSLRVTGKTEKYSRLSFDATITNNGSFVCREFYILLGGTRVGGRKIEIEAGSTVTLPFTFTPTSSGRKDLTLCYYLSGDYIPIANCTIDINEPSEADLSITEKIHNVINGIVKEDKIVVQASVVNNGSQAYDNDIVGELYRLRNDGSGSGDYVTSVNKSIQLSPGKTTSVDLSFNNLDKGKYFYYLYYLSEGKLKGKTGGNIVIVQVEQEQSLKGDVNGDKLVNGTDIVALASIIMGQQAQNATADVNGDGIVNGTDIVKLVSIILNSNN